MKNLPFIVHKYRLYVDILLIIIGAGLSALAYPMFLIPLKIVPGGVSGLSIVIHHLTGFPVGLTGFVLNIPILIAGFILIGKVFALRTIIGMTLCNLLIDFFTYIVKVPAVTDDMLLGSIFGGILLGLGLGIIFLANASTGGSDVIGQIISKYSNFTAGIGIMITDFLVISLSGIVFRSFELPLYGYTSLIISSTLIDRVMQGSDYARGVFIITEKKELVKEFIFIYLERGITEFHGRTGFSQKETDIVFTAIGMKQLPILKRYVKKIDPEAFIVVTDVFEIIGKGFSQRNILNSSKV